MMLNRALISQICQVNNCTSSVPYVFFSPKILRLKGNDRKACFKYEIAADSVPFFKSLQPTETCRELGWIKEEIARHI